MRVIGILGIVAMGLGANACGRVDHFGKAPDFSPSDGSTEQVAMMFPGLPLHSTDNRAVDRSSTWSHNSRSLLGDRRALKKGDILTVVIEIDERAEISNDTSRSREADEELGIPQFFGVPQRIDQSLPNGASMDEAVDISSSSSSRGQGSVKREEELVLKVAATVVDVLPNGVLSIQGSQEVRVNYELRELLIRGYVRPGDISRMNQITYDKIASARISYGGRGQISDVQQPRYGQQALDAILPY